MPAEIIAESRRWDDDTEYKWSNGSLQWSVRRRPDLAYYPNADVEDALRSPNDRKLLKVDFSAPNASTRFANESSDRDVPKLVSGIKVPSNVISVPETYFEAATS
jgi:hypothetical protein